MVQRFAGDVPEFAALLIFNTYKENRIFFVGAESAADAFLVRREPVIEAAFRIAGKEIERSDIVLIQDGEQLGGKFLLFFPRDAAVFCRWLEILNSDGISFVLCGFDEAEDAAARGFAAERIGRNGGLLRGWSGGGCGRDAGYLKRRSVRGKKRATEQRY